MEAAWIMGIVLSVLLGLMLLAYQLFYQSIEQMKETRNQVESVELFLRGDCMKEMAELLH